MKEELEEEAPQLKETEADEEQNKIRSPEVEAQKAKHFRDGVMCLFGGFMIQMFGGSFFLWAQISNYVLSYLYWENKKHDFKFMKMTPTAIFYVDFALALVNVIGYQVGALLIKKRYNPRLVIAVASTISLIGFMAASFTISFVPFILCYGVIGAVGCGTVYMIPLICGWEYFPDRKGLVTGIVMSAYGFGSFAYTLIAQAIVNPDNH